MFECRGIAKHMPPYHVCAIQNPCVREAVKNHSSKTKTESISVPLTGAYETKKLLHIRRAG